MQSINLKETDIHDLLSISEQLTRDIQGQQQNLNAVNNEIASRVTERRKKISEEMEKTSS